MNGQWAVIGSGSGRMVRQGYAFVRSYSGTVCRIVGSKREYVSCPHNHRSPSAARKCAEREVKRRNA